MRRFAVGKPSVPPRASPETTVPSTSTGRPSSARRGADVAGGDEPPDRVDETPSTSGHDPRREPEPLEQREVAAAGRARSGTPRRRPPARRRSPARYERANVLRLERRDLGRELDDERLLDAERREQLEPPLERREQLDLVAEHLARMRVEGDDRRRAARPRPRPGRPPGGRRGRRRTCRSRPRAAAARARPGRARPSRRPTARGLARRSAARRATSLGRASSASTCARTLRHAGERVRRQPRRAPPTTAHQPVRVGLLDPERARPPFAAASRSARRAPSRSSARRFPEPTCSASCTLSPLYAMTSSA